MGETTIEWTEKVWNPITGCSKVSAGCLNCYAEHMAKRLQGRGDPHYAKGFELTCHEDRLEEPLHWRKPQTVFVCSMSDLFHEKVPFEFVNRLMQVIAETPRHTYQVLTKRPERMARWYGEWWRPDKRNRYKRGGRTRLRPRLFLRRPGCSECRYHFLGCVRGRKKWKDEPVTPNFRLCDHKDYFGWDEAICDAFEWHKDSVGHGVAVAMNNGEISVRDEDCVGGFPGPLKNLRLGVSVENQPAADERILHLLKCPAAVRFLSIEPMLGPIDLDSEEANHGHTLGCDDLGCECGERGVDWVIVGCETGPGARPMKIEWVRSIRNQCAAAGVPFFLKAMMINGKKVSMPKLDGVVHDAMPKAVQAEAGASEEK